MNIQKNALILLVLAVFAAGCKKEPGVVTFDVKSESTFVIEGNNSILDLPAIITPSISTNWSGEFSNNNTNKEKIRDMRLRTLVLNITAPAGQTFDFLKDIHIYIQADGLQETEIAYRTNIPENIGQTLELETKDVDLAPYAKKDAFKLRVKASQRKFNPNDTQMRADMVFKVTANVLD